MVKYIMNLFIDTNIYLSFYHFTSDDLEELRKLLTAITKGKINLYITPHLKDEFRRNREIKIADAIKQFTKKHIDIKFPNFCKEYSEYEHLRSTIHRFKDTRNQLLDKLIKDVEENSLEADKLIHDLFDKADEINMTNSI